MALEVAGSNPVIHPNNVAVSVPAATTVFFGGGGGQGLVPTEDAADQES